VNTNKSERFVISFDFFYIKAKHSPCVACIEIYYNKECSTFFMNSHVLQT